MAETVDFVKGRESVWIELLQRAEQEVYKRDDAIKQLVDKLKPQEDNETLIDNQAARIRGMEEKLEIEIQRTDHAEVKLRHLQVAYTHLLEMCMTTNNLSAEQRLYAIRNEHTEVWATYKEAKRKENEED